MVAVQDREMEFKTCITTSCEHRDVGLDVMSVGVVSKVDIWHELGLSQGVRVRGKCHFYENNTMHNSSLHVKTKIYQIRERKLKLEAKTVNRYGGRKRERGRNALLKLGGAEKLALKKPGQRGGGYPPSRP